MKSARQSSLSQKAASTKTDRSTASQPELAVQRTDPTLLRRATNTSAPPLTPNDILTLQQTVGNRAVQRLLVQRSPDPARPRAASSFRIQPKLTVGPAHDSYEQEADRVAAQVTSRLTTSSQPQVLAQPKAEELQTKPLIQPQSIKEGLSVPNEVENSIQSAQGGGQPLAQSLREPMENSFGADFSGVKVHTDVEADTLNRSVQARAFTTGQDIFFKKGEYQPGSSAGQKLIAHELTHTIQQGAAPIARAADPQKGTEPSTSVAEQPVAGPVIQRAVGFEFEDPSWSVFVKQPGRQFRNPSFWGRAKEEGWGGLGKGVLKAVGNLVAFPLTLGQATFSMGYWKKLFGSGNVAPPGSERTDEERQSDEYQGRNIWPEASDPANHINQRVSAFNLMTAPKKGTLHSGEGYDIEPDGPYTTGRATNRMDLEIVTQPFPETRAGRAQLIAALTDLQAVFGHLRATGEWNGGPFNYANFVTPQEHGFSGGIPDVYLYGGIPGGAFKPQVTSGISLADLPAMMEAFGASRNNTENRQAGAGIRRAVYGDRADTADFQRGAIVNLVGSAPHYAAMVTTDLLRRRILSPNPEGVNALRGFLAQAILYITGLSITGKEGVKVMVPLLSRHSFATLFEAIPEATRDELRTYLIQREFFAILNPVVQRSIYDFLSLKFQDEELAGRMSRTALDGPMLSTLLKERGQTATRLNRALSSFTRREWLRQVFNGRDLLTPAGLLGYLAGTEHADTAEEYNKSIAIYLRGHGNVSHVRDVPGEDTQSLALLENRNITKVLTLAEASTMALQYFDAVVAIKQLSQRQREDERVTEAVESIEVGSPPTHDTPSLLSQVPDWSF